MLEELIKCFQKGSKNGNGNGKKGCSKIKELVDRVPPNQMEQFKIFQAKHEQYQARVNRYPEKMPTIDWKYYEQNVRKDYVLWVKEFQKKYDAVDTMFGDRYSMIDPSKYFGEIEKQTEEVEKMVCQYKEESDKRIKILEGKIEHLKNVKDYNHMTMEEFCLAHPEEAPDFINKPTFWPHTPDEQKPGPIEEHHHEDEEEEKPPKGANPDPGKTPPAPAGGAPPEAKAEPAPPVKKEDPKPSQLAETASALATKGIALATALAMKAIEIIKGLIAQAGKKQNTPKGPPAPVHNEKFSKLDKSEDICNKTYIRGAETAKADVKEHHTDLSTDGASDDVCPPKPKCSQPEPEPKCPKPEPEPKCPKPEPEPKCSKPEPEPKCDTPKPTCGNQEQESKSPCDRFTKKDKPNQCEPTASSLGLAPGTPSTPKPLSTSQQEQQQPQTPPSDRPLATEFNHPIMGTNKFGLPNEKEVPADAKATVIQPVKDAPGAMVPPTKQPDTKASIVQPVKEVVPEAKASIVQPVKEVGPDAKASIIQPVKETIGAVVQPDSKVQAPQPVKEVLPEAKSSIIQPVKETTGAVEPPATKVSVSQTLKEGLPDAKAAIIQPVKEERPDTKASIFQPAKEVPPDAKSSIIQPVKETAPAETQPKTETAIAPAQPTDNAVEKKSPTSFTSNLTVRSKREDSGQEVPPKSETRVSKEDDKNAGSTDNSSATEMAKAMFQKAIGAANSLSEAKRIIEQAQRDNAGDLTALASAYEKAQDQVKLALSKSYDALQSARTLSEQTKSTQSHQDAKVNEMIDKHAMLAKMLASRAITMQKAIVKVLTEIQKKI